MKTIKIDDNRCLMVCICGKHKEGHAPLDSLMDANVVIHYVDEADDIIKPLELTSLIEKKEREAWADGFKKGQSKGILDCTYGQRTVNDLKKEGKERYLKEKEVLNHPRMKETMKGLSNLDTHKIEKEVRDELKDKQ